MSASEAKQPRLNVFLVTKIFAWKWLTNDQCCSLATKFLAEILLNSGCKHGFLPSTKMSYLEQ